MKTRQAGVALLAIGMALGWAAWGGLGQAPARTIALAAAKDQEAEPAPKVAESRPKDRAAIAKTEQSFVKAFEAGDAKAVAAHWTSEGEYVNDEGAATRGRATLEKAYVALFVKYPKNELTIDVRKLSFPSRDTAIEEGYFKVRRSKTEGKTLRPYSILWVREDGKWLMAQLRELSEEGDSLDELDWLIGDWLVKSEDVEVRSTYTWWKNKSFIRMTFTIKDKDRTTSGFQMIGKDAATRQLRSWTFEDSGGFGQADWTRDEKKWLVDSSGVTADGAAVTATNVFMRLSDNAFTWQSTNRTQDGEEVADLPPVKVTRVKAKE